jgi:hypothetical protein
MAMNTNNADSDANDRPVKAKQPRPSLIEFLSDPAQAMAPEVELDMRSGRPDDAAREGEFLTAKELVARASERGAVLTEADARAIKELKKL